MPSQPLCEPTQLWISGIVPLGERVKTQSPADPAFFDPVHRVVTAISPVVLLTVNDATYCVTNVEQPDASMVAGQLPFVETYSLIDVLHAAAAATPSDIFERIT